MITHLAAFVAKAMRELHWDSDTMAETLSIGTGRKELHIGLPPGMAIQTYANPQIKVSMPQIRESMALQSRFKKLLTWPANHQGVLMKRVKR